MSDEDNTDYSCRSITVHACVPQIKIMHFVGHGLWIYYWIEKKHILQVVRDEEITLSVTYIFDDIIQIL